MAWSYKTLRYVDAVEIWEKGSPHQIVCQLRPVLTITLLFIFNGVHYSEYSGCEKVERWGLTTGKFKLTPLYFIKSLCVCVMNEFVFNVLIRRVKVQGNSLADTVDLVREYGP